MLQQTANNRRALLLRRKASWDAGAGQQIAGNLYRGQGGRFTAGGGGALTPAQQRSQNRTSERTAYDRDEDARRQAEDESIAREPNRTKRAALRRAIVAARRQRLYARREQRRQLDDQDAFARAQEAQERARQTAERRARRIAEVQARREEAARKKPPKEKKPTKAERREAAIKRLETEGPISRGDVEGIESLSKGGRTEAAMSERFIRMGLAEWKGGKVKLTEAGKALKKAIDAGDYDAIVQIVRDAQPKKQPRETPPGGVKPPENRGPGRGLPTPPRNEPKPAPPSQRGPIKPKIPGAQKSTFRIYKDARGHDRWVAISSTAYRDRDGEIVSRKALRAAVARADATGERGPLRFWHVPGLDLGDCDFQATSQDGRFLIESGTFRHPGYAAALKARGQGWGISIGFLHPPDQPDADGVFSDIAIFERSLTPPGRASNRFTQITAKEIRMQLAPDREAQLASLLGGRDTPAFKAAYAELAAAEKTAASSGATFKEGPAEEGLPLLTDTDGQQYTVKEGKLIALKAPEPPAEMVEAGETEVADGEAEMGLEDLLSDGDVQRVATAVIEGLSPFFDIQKQVGDLKSALGMVGTTKEEKPATVVVNQTAAAPSPDLAALQATVKEMEIKLKELLSDRPMGRASQSAETVVAADSPLQAGYKGAADGAPMDYPSALAGFLPNFRQPG